MGNAKSEDVSSVAPIEQSKPSDLPDRPRPLQPPLAWLQPQKTLAGSTTDTSKLRRTIDNDGSVNDGTESKTISSERSDEHALTNAMQSFKISHSNTDIQVEIIASAICLEFLVDHI